MELQLKRIYDDPRPEDGFRVLVDRLWPRGLSKQRAAVDLWAKDAAPSAELRKAWHAAPTEAWDAFAEEYRAELDGESRPAVDALREQLRLQPVATLLFAAHDPRRTHAIVLRDALGL